MNRFRNRSDAGQQLAARLAAYRDRAIPACVLGMARGGVPVAFEVAKALHAPLDVIIVRKLGVPGAEELAMGAIAGGNVRVMNANVVEQLMIPESLIDAVAVREMQELQRRERTYRGNRPPLDVRGRLVILIDDGIATGASVRAAIRSLQQQRPARLVVAVPVAAAQECTRLSHEVDELICLLQPWDMGGVGLWYADFHPVTDREVRDLLEEAEAISDVEDATQQAPGPPTPSPTEQEALQ